MTEERKTDDFVISTLLKNEGSTRKSQNSSRQQPDDEQRPPHGTLKRAQLHTSQRAGHGHERAPASHDTLPVPPSRARRRGQRLRWRPGHPGGHAAWHPGGSDYSSYITQTSSANVLWIQQVHSRTDTGIITSKRRQFTPWVSL